MSGCAVWCLDTLARTEDALPGTRCFAASNCFNLCTFNQLAALEYQITHGFPVA